MLVTQFNGVGTRLAGGNLVPGSDQVEVCGEEPCDEGTRTFKLDKSLRRAQILTLAPKPGTVVQIDGPKGATARISQAGTSTVGATDVERARLPGGARHRPRPAVGPRRPGTASGRCRSSTRPRPRPAMPATIQIFVFSDIGVAFSQVLPLERGTSTTIAVGAHPARGREGRRRHRLDHRLGPVAEPCRPGRSTPWS